MQRKQAVISSYPNLYKKFPFAHFHVIMDAISEEFSHLFILSILEKSVENNKLAAEPYFCWFSTLIKTLEDKTRKEEIIAHLAFELNNLECIRNFYKKKLIFVADQTGLYGEQLGYIERVLCGKAKPAESLSFLDLLRFKEIYEKDLSYDSRRNQEQDKDLSDDSGRDEEQEQDRDLSDDSHDHKKKWKDKYKTGVFHLKQLKTIHHLRQSGFYSRKLTEFEQLLINVNLDLAGTPKWVAVQFKELKNKNEAVFYSESAFLPKEQILLEEMIGSEVSNIRYDESSSKSDHGISSAYLALLWLNGEVASDNFWALRTRFMRFLRSINLIQYANLDYLSESILHVFRAYKNAVPDEWKSFNDDFFNIFFHLSRYYGYDIYPLTETLKGKTKLNTQRLIENLWFEENYPDFYNSENTHGNSRSDQAAIKEKIKDKTDYTLAFSNIDQALGINFAMMLTSGNGLAYTLFQFLYTCHHLKTLTLNIDVDQNKDYRLGLKKKEIFNPEQMTHFENQFKENASLQQWEILGLEDTNASAQISELFEKLAPTLARNRWLAENNYRPALMANHWRVAAKKWVHFLFKNVILFKNPEGTHSAQFKNHVGDMGVEGLKQLFEYLTEEQSVIEKIIDHNFLAFYAVYTPKNGDAYFRLLIEHLKANRYFPFEKINLCFMQIEKTNIFSTQETTPQFVELIHELNRLPHIQSIQFDHFMQTADQTQLTDSLSQLASRALEEKWTHLIVITDLDRPFSQGHHLPLRNAYQHLNNIILKNRLVKNAKPLVDGYIQKIKIDFNSEKSVNNTTRLPTPSIASSIPSETISSLFQNGRKFLLSTGSAQLQIQNQQQIQQQQQVQNQTQIQQHVDLDQSDLTECPLESHLVSYDNINDLLNADYQALSKQMPGMSISQFTMTRTGASPLQNFFLTMINVNAIHPQARHVIRYMTQDAAKYLLLHHRKLSFGFNAGEHYPKGFFTQRNKHDELVLCYRPDYGYTKQPTPLTQQLSQAAPQAQRFQGDFRQLDFDYYAQPNKPLNLSQKEFHDMSVFVALQPHRNLNPQKKIEEMVETHPELKELVFSNINKVQDHFPIFYQTYEYAGAKGILAFIHQDQVTLDPKSAFESLLKNYIAVFEQTIDFNFESTHYLALAQLYYQLGIDSVTAFLSMLQTIKNTLGKDFFDGFKYSFLSTCHNYTALFSNAFLDDIKCCCSELSKPEQSDLIPFWISISAAHAKGVGFESFGTLWNGFYFFVQALKKEGVSLCNRLDALPEVDMLTWMSRVLACVKTIPQQKQRQIFLDQVTQFDLTHGGLPYAMQYDDIQYADKNLKLENFHACDPTYAPNLKNINDWRSEDFPLLIQRSLATHAFLDSEYSQLHEYFNSLSQSHPDTARDLLLILLLSAQEPVKNITDLLKALTSYPSVVHAIATQLHQSFQKSEQASSTLTLSTLLAVCKSPLTIENWNAIQIEYQPLFLEAVMILHQRQGMKELPQLIALLSNALNVNQVYSIRMMRAGIRLAAILGQYQTKKIIDFLEKTKSLQSAYQAEQLLENFIDQLLLINWKTSHLENLNKEDNWNFLTEPNRLETYINHLIQDPWNANDYIDVCFEMLRKQNIIFQFIDQTSVRSVLDTDYPKLAKYLDAFGDDRDSVWTFFKNHILISNEKPVNESLSGLLAFFKTIYLKKSNIKEMIPLLSILSTEQNTYWHADYLFDLLTALKTDNDEAAYPLSILSKILEETPFQSKPMAKVTSLFPKYISDEFRKIIYNTENNIFTREQKSLLCQLFSREYASKKSNVLLEQMTETLRDAKYSSKFRTQILSTLIKLNNHKKIEESWKIHLDILTVNPAIPLIQTHWSSICELWSHHLANEEIQNLLSQINKTNEKKPFLLMMIAFSCFQEDPIRNEHFQVYLEKKLTKLLSTLMNYSIEDLNQLSNSYTYPPYPNAYDLLQIDKNIKINQYSLTEALTAFQKSPSGLVRKDYGKLSQTRHQSFQRMLMETKVGGENRLLRPEELERISIRFAYLKKLESGDLLVNGLAIKKMSQAELTMAFYQYGECVKSSDEALMILWAIIFEVMAITTKKYPNLAQQYATITMDIALNSPYKILKLDTGEGKSLFTTLRALRSLAEKKKVHLYTIKATLSERDQEAFEKTFSYLHLKSTCLDVYSKPDTLMEYDVVYSTPSTFALHRTYCAYIGKPIPIDYWQNCMAIFDEFDATLEEGMQTVFNFSIDSNTTPDQMRWLLRAVNEFYSQNEESILKQIEQDNKIYIYESNLHQLIDFLTQKAGAQNSKLSDVEQLKQNPIELIHWLQAAHIAHHLYQGVNFTLIKQMIFSGDEPIPMRAIVPLSSENQKMSYSHFSGGVQQLLAELSNHREITQSNGNPDIHTPSLNQIISSQISTLEIKKYSAWESYSGSFSTLQIQTLHKEFHAEILHAPTNQASARQWIAPEFFDTDQDQIRRLAEQVKICFKENKTLFIPPANDKMTLDLKKLLKPHFSDAMGQLLPEWDQIFFVTNQDSRSNKQLFEEIKIKQNGKEGKKGVAIFSSMHGRGDDLKADSVILLKIKSETQRIQNGGRIARNGAQGNVYQFYLWPEIEGEHKRQLVYARARNKEIDSRLNAINEQEPLANPKAQIHRELLYLNEYIEHLDNEARQAYWIARAEYCLSIIDLFAALKEHPENKSILMPLWIKEFKSIEQAWLEISSEEMLSEPEKIEKIREKINQSTHAFFQILSQSLNDWNALDIKTFKLSEHQTEQMQIHENVNAISKPADRKSALLIAMALSDFHMPNDGKRITNVLDQLSTLKKNSEAYAAFAQSVEQHSSFDAFECALSEKLSSLNQIRAAHTDDHQEEQLINTLILLIERQTTHLTPNLKTQLKETLQKTPSILSHQKSLFKIINFLSRFSAEEQTQWGPDYIEQLPDLIQTPMPLLKQRCSAAPMAFQHHQTIWRLSKSHTRNESDCLHLLTLLNKTIQNGLTEQSLHWLEQCETLLLNRDTELNAFAFLSDVCQVMQGCTPETAARFDDLLSQTSQHWRKDHLGKHQTLFLSVWHELARSSKNIPDILNYLPGHETLGKLNWIWPTLYLTLDSERLKKHWSFLKNVMAELATLPSKKSIRALLMHEIVQALMQSSANSTDFDIEHIKYIFSILKKPQNQERINKNQFKAILNYQFPSINELSLIDKKNPTKNIIHLLLDENAHTEQWNSTQFKTYLNKLNEIIPLFSNLNNFWRVWHKDSHLTKNDSEAILLIDCVMQHRQEIDRLLIDFCTLQDFNLSKLECSQLANQLIAIYEMLDSCDLENKKSEDLRKKFLKLAPNQRIQCLSIIHQFKQTCLNNPSLIGILIDQLVNNKSVLHLEITCQALANQKLDEKQISNMSTLVCKVPDTHSSALKQLLTRYPNHAPHLLTDGVLNYSVKNTANLGTDFQVVLNAFYQIFSTSNQAISAADFTSSEPFHSWFSFKEKTSESKRRLLMTLLYQGIFVTQHTSIWTTEKNTQLIHALHKKYVKFSEEILKTEKPQKKSDLSIKQQMSLLKLSRELKTIYTDENVQQTSWTDDPNRLSSLKKKVDTKLTQYALLNKSSSRNNQLKTFQQALNQAFSDPLKNGETHYEKALVAIEVAKRSAIQADKQAYFTQNKKGHSRYFDTLDQLYHLVLSHWARDLKVIPKFASHDELFSNRFLNALIDLKETFSTKDQTQFADLYALLPDRSSHKSMNPNDLIAHSVLLSHDLPHLPGHLVALAGSIASQAKSLVSATLSVHDRKLCLLFKKIYQKLDAYEAMNKSGARKNSLSQLKQQLISAMKSSKNDKDRHKNMLDSIKTIKSNMLTEDEQYNTQTLFFKINRKGYSHYLRLLSDLEIEISSHWVESYPEKARDQTQLLTDDFNQIKNLLIPHIQAVEAEYASKKIPAYFYKNDWDKVKKLKDRLNNPNVSGDQNDLTQLLNVIPSVSLPGHIATLSDQLLKIGEKLVFHIKTMPTQSNQAVDSDLDNTLII